MINTMTKSRGHVERLPTFNENKDKDILEFLDDCKVNPHHNNCTNRELTKTMP